MTTQRYTTPWIATGPTSGGPPGPPELSDTQLLLQYEDSRAVANTALILKGHLEQEIYRRMEERGARAIPDETFVCQLTQELIY